MNKSIEAVLMNTDLNQRKTLNDIVYEGFFKTIVKGGIPAGERINEKEYSDQMHISRTPIRYAMKLLERDGLVEYIPKMGMVVKKITTEDACEIFAIRSALEVLATTTAMNNMSETDFDELDELLTQTEALSASGNLEELPEVFEKFHEFIYQKSNMKRLNDLTSRMKEYLIRFRSVSLSRDSRRDLAISDHRRIYYAMRKKDETLLREVIQQHLKDALAFTLTIMEKESQL